MHLLPIGLQREEALQLEVGELQQQVAAASQLAASGAEAGAAALVEMRGAVEAAVGVQVQRLQEEVQVRTRCMCMSWRHPAATVSSCLLCSCKLSHLHLGLDAPHASAGGFIALFLAVPLTSCC
jgi:hypothetical protein